MLKHLRNLLVWSLIIQMIGLPVATRIPEAVAGSSTIEPPKELHPVTQHVLKQTDDPFMEYLLRSDIPLPTAEFNFVADDPVMDQDPFFMRSQRWLKREIPAEQASNLLRLKLDETGFLPTLEIQQPFHEILRTDDFIFLSPNDDRYFDSKVLASEGSQSKGVFILHRETWQKAALNRMAAPIYFLPLHDGNWGKSAQAHEIPEHDAVYFTDGKSPGVPIPFHDLEVLVKAESLNLFLASTLALVGSSREILQAMIDQKKPSILRTMLLPPRGSTAGFGVVYTGMDLDHPGRKIDVSHVRKKSSLMQKVLSGFTLLPSAHAEGFLTQSTVERLKKVAWITGISLALSVYLRAVTYRKFFAKIEEQEKAEGSKSSWIGRNTRYFLTTEAHVLLLLSQIPTSTFGNAIEYTADRYFPRQGSGERKPLRGFFKETVLRSRDNAERVPVNYWTYLMGTGVIGSIDTFFVAVQTYWVVPKMMTGLGEMFPSLREKAEAAVDANNPNLDAIRRNDVIRNGIAYMTAGAASYSADIQSQLRQLLEPKIEEEMLRDGLNPKDPKNFSIKESRFKIKLETEMKAKGLPGSDEFLFDYSSIYENAMAVLGFRTESNKHLIGVSRPGLTLSSLNKAISKLNKRLKKSPNDSELFSALQILERTKRDVSFLWNFSFAAVKIKNKFNGQTIKEEMVKAADAVFRAKRSLLSLTYEGDRGLDLKNVPSRWVEEFNAEGARIAAQTYRESFYDMVTGQKTSVDPGEMTSEIEKKAEENAKQELKARLDIPEESKDQIPDHLLNGAELDFLIEKEKIKLATEAAEASTPYQPPKLGWVERYQIRRVVRKSDEKYLAQYKESFDASVADSDELKNWQKIFTQTYAQMTGLYPEIWHSKEASEAAQKFISDPKVAEYLKTLSSKESATLVATYQATAEIDQYLKITVNDPNADALGSHQPGVTQKVRQKTVGTKWKFFNKVASKVLHSRVATRTLRAIDSFGSQQDYRTGVAAWVYRNVPMAFDIWKGLGLRMSQIPTTLTATFLWNKLFWGVTYTPAMWAFSSLLGFTVSAPSRTLNRFFQNQGIKPMGKVTSVILLGIIYSWVTFFGFIPTQLFAADFQNLWDSAFEMMKNACSFRLGGK